MTSPSLRERKRAATEYAIQRAALDLVLARGYEKVTVAEICETAGISEKTFFNYCGSKDAAIVGPTKGFFDPSAAEEFVRGDGRLLAGVLSIVATSLEYRTQVHELVTRRREVFARYPQLVRAELAAIDDLEVQMAEIIRWRLGDTAATAEGEELLAATTAAASAISRYAVRLRAEGAASLPAAMEKGYAAVRRLFREDDE